MVAGAALESFAAETQDLGSTPSFVNTCFTYNAPKT